MDISISFLLTPVSRYYSTYTSKYREEFLQTGLGLSAFATLVALVTKVSAAYLFVAGPAFFLASAALAFRASAEGFCVENHRLSETLEEAQKNCDNGQLLLAEVNTRCLEGEKKIEELEGQTSDLRKLHNVTLQQLIELQEAYQKLKRGSEDLARIRDRLKHIVT